MPIVMSLVPAGGFYVAYPTGNPSLNSVRLWRVGAATSARIARRRASR